jgi:hypothetical protein
MSSGAPSPAGNVSYVLETATQLFRATLLKCLPLAMVVLLCAEVPNLYWLASGHPLAHGWPSDRTYWALSIIAAAVMLYVASAVMLQQRSLASGVRLSTVTALRAAARRLPSVLLTWVLAYLSLVVGLTLLILPGLFLFVCYLIMLPVVLFEQRNPYIVLVRCVLLIRPYWWKTLAALVIAILVVLVFVLAFGAILGILSAMLTGPAFQAIATACSIAFFAMVGVFFSALVLTLHSAAASSSA